MKAIGKCEVCGGKIIKNGIGNIYCEDCHDKYVSEKSQEWADRNRKINQRKEERKRKC